MASEHFLVDSPPSKIPISPSSYLPEPVLSQKITTPRQQFQQTSGERFYSRVRLVKAEEIASDSSNQRNIAHSRRGPRSQATTATNNTTESRQSNNSRSQSRNSIRSRTPGSPSSKTNTTTKAKPRSRSRPNSTNNNYRTESMHRRSNKKKTNGLDDKYNAYPWSSYFRDEVMVLNKMPKPPYFLQLPSGLRPDTIVLRNIPVSWFLDTPEEVQAEHELELATTKVTTFPGARTVTPGGTSVQAENKEPQSDSPFWFTKHGHILIKAACMRFGPVKHVDLVFEMESRDEEWTLCFDAYIQFKYFSGFRDCYIGFDGGMFLHDEDLASMFLIPEFDTTGHFSDHQIQLRKVRKEMEDTKLEQEEYQRKKIKYKLKKKYKEDVIKMKKVIHKLSNDMENVELDLKRLLSMDHYKHANSDNNNNAENNYIDLMEEEEGKNEMIERREGKQGKEGKEGKEEKEDDWKNEQDEMEQEEEQTITSSKNSNIYIAATEDARECMSKAREFINKLPETGESDVNVETGIVTGALSLVPKAKQLLSQLNKSIKYTDKLIFKEHTIRTVQVPSLLEVLERDGEVDIVLERVKQKIQMEGPEYFHGITLFVPHDRGFSEETFFDEACWGTHILRGPYQMRDLHDLSNYGPGNLECEDCINNLSVGINESGEFIVWVGKVGHPQRKCRVERQDINVKNGTVLHFVDRVLFPPAF